MRAYSWLSMCLSGAIPAVLFGAVSLAPTGAAAADCTFTPPLTAQTRCLTAVAIPGNPLRSFDISFINPAQSRILSFRSPRTRRSTSIDTETS